MQEALLIGSANTEDVIILKEFPIENHKQRYAKIFRFEDRSSHPLFNGIGGSAVNWSFWLTAAGEHPLLLCPIGSDERGEQMRNVLAEAHIENQENSGLVLADEDHAGDEQSSCATAHSYILVAQNRESRTIIASPQDSRLSIQWSTSLEAHVGNVLKEHSYVKTAMIGNIAGDSEENNITPKIINMIKNHDESIFLYANLGRSQYSVPYQTWAKSIRKVDCFQFALNEAKEFVMAGDRGLTRKPSLEDSLRFFFRNELNVIITLGRGGAISLFGALRDNSVLFTFPRNPRRDIVDPTGAGDAFGAGFVSCINRILSKHRPPLKAKNDRLDALGTGSYFGAMACLGYGGSGSCPGPGECAVHVGDYKNLELSQSCPLDDAGDWLYAFDRDY